MTRAVIFDMYETLITHFKSPLYFGAQMAVDAGIPEAQFQALWRPTNDDRTTGCMTLEEAVRQILTACGCYSDARLNTIVQKRMDTKRVCFEQLHPEILPMLRGLKERRIKIGLISNCYSEEVPAIRSSVLFPYFDAVCLSYEEGIQKPDAAIYERCMDRLGVQPSECLYIGDGGSFELETAARLGLRAMQAVWYLQEGSLQPVGRKPAFAPIETPLDVLKLI